MSVYCIVNQAMRLSDPTRKIQLREPLAYTNQLAHSFRVTVLPEPGESSVDLTGVGVTGNFQKMAVNETVTPINGTVNGAVAEVVLPASCYTTPGRFKFTLDLAQSVSTDGVDAFSTSVDYAIGDQVVYSGVVWAFKAAHSAGAWIGTDAMVVAYNRTALWIEGMVERNMSGTIIDPGTPVANITQAINNANAAAAAATSAAEDAASAAEDAEGAAQHSVRYDEAQTLEPEDQAQARSNIGAANVTVSGTTIVIA